MDSELLRPGGAAKKLGMPASTLRVYSTRFAELLSQSGSDPPVTPEGKAGTRLYTSGDLTVLSKAKELLGRGLTYEQAMARLRSSLPGARMRARAATEEAVGRNSGVGLLSTNQIEALVNTFMAGALAQVERITQSWKTLAEDRAKENAELRARIRDLEGQMAELMPRQRGLWSRLFNP